MKSLIKYLIDSKYNKEYYITTKFINFKKINNINFLKNI